MPQYIKLKELVDNTFTIEKINGYTWKKWDEAQKQMLSADTWSEGYSKSYEVETDKGTLNLSKAQIAQALEAVLENGISNLNGKTIAVKSNGQQGKDIRYFLNRAKEEREVPKPEDKLPDDNFRGEPLSPEDLSSIPF